MKKIISTLLVLPLCFFLSAQPESYTCYPSHWWKGMKWNKVQVMVYGKSIADDFPMIKMGPKGVVLAPGVYLIKINRVENPNYVFLDLAICKKYQHSI